MITVSLKLEPLKALFPLNLASISYIPISDPKLINTLPESSVIPSYSLSLTFTQIFALPIPAPLSSNKESTYVALENEPLK